MNVVNPLTAFTVWKMEGMSKSKLQASFLLQYDIPLPSESKIPFDVAIPLHCLPLKKCIKIH